MEGQSRASLFSASSDAKVLNHRNVTPKSDDVSPLEALEFKKAIAMSACGWWATRIRGWPRRPLHSLVSNATT